MFARGNEQRLCGRKIKFRLKAGRAKDAQPIILKDQIGVWGNGMQHFLTEVDKPAGWVNHIYGGVGISAKGTVKRVDGKIAAQGIHLRRIGKAYSKRLMAAAVAIHAKGGILRHVMAIRICQMKLYRAKMGGSQARGYGSALTQLRNGFRSGGATNIHIAGGQAHQRVANRSAHRVERGLRICKNTRQMT